MTQHRKGISGRNGEKGMAYRIEKEGKCNEFMAKHLSGIY